MYANMHTITETKALKPCTRREHTPCGAWALSHPLSLSRMSVYTCVAVSDAGAGGAARCFSSMTPVTGFLWRRMKWTCDGKGNESTVRMRGRKNSSR